MTRNCCSPEGYEVESEPDTDDTDSYMGYDDMEVEGVPVDEDDAAAGMIPVEEETDSDADEPDTDDMDYGVWTVEYGEVVGGDDVVAGMIPAEEETDKEDEVARPTRRVRNVVDSDDDGDVAAGPVHPPGTMAVFDELAPGDIINPCEFQIKVNTVM